MTLKEQATQNLLDMGKLLKEMGIVFWLDGGTLLGAYRDKDFCDGDEDDIDLCAWDNYKSDEIVRRAKELGFSIDHEWPSEIAFTRGSGESRSKVDLFFIHKSKDTAYTYLYAGENVHSTCIIPAHFYEELGLYEFKGEIYNIPRDIEEYLTLKYGDWRTPIHRSVYSCYDSQQNKVVIRGDVFKD